MHGSYNTCMAYVLCQMFCLPHAGHAMRLMLWLGRILDVCFVNGCLLDHAYSSKLPKTLDEDLADIPVRFVGHPASCFHVHMMYNASNSAQQGPGLYCKCCKAAVCEGCNILCSCSDNYVAILKNTHLFGCHVLLNTSTTGCIVHLQGFSSSSNNTREATKRQVTAVLLQHFVQDNAYCDDVLMLLNGKRPALQTWV